MAVHPHSTRRGVSRKRITIDRVFIWVSVKADTMIYEALPNAIALA